MPNFIKSLFKPPSTQSKGSTHPQPLSADFDLPSPSSARRDQLPTEDLEALTALLRRELESGDKEGSHRLLEALGHGQGDSDGAMEHLLEALEALQREKEEERVTPFRSESNYGGSVLGKAASLFRANRKGKAKALTGGSGGPELAGVLEACAAAIGES